MYRIYTWKLSTTLLYNRPTIHLIQRYNGLCELTNCNVNIWAIHMTLYRVCCIEYSWLFVKAQYYAVLWISHSKCIFLAFKQFDSPKPTQILKNIWWHTDFFHSHNLIARNQYNFKKHMKNRCISVSDFYNKHTLLYNLPTIHSIQRYNGLCELTNCFNILWYLFAF